MRRIKFKMEKRGALELSISTIVVIVIGMSMLILGLVLVNSIFSGAKGSVDAINDGVMDEIEGLFQDNGGDFIVKLGAQKIAKVKPGDFFGVAIGVRHPSGATVNRDTINYKIELDSNSNDNCFQKLGQRRTEDLFKTSIDSWNNFDEFKGSNAFALIELEVPKGTEKCTQKVNIDVKLSEGGGDPFEGSFFLLEVIKEGIF